MRARYHIIVVLFCLFYLQTAFAQRMTPGRPSLELGYTIGSAVAGLPEKPMGFELTWSNYYFHGYTSFTLDVYAHQFGYTIPAVYDSTGGFIAPEESIHPDAYDLLLGMGYHYRLLSTRNRFFILSVGAGIFLGIDYCKDMANVEKSGGGYYNSVGFLMNVIPEVKAELFPFSNVSLFASARPRLQCINGLAAKDYWFRPAYAFGLKYYL